MKLVLETKQTVVQLTLESLRRYLLNHFGTTPACDRQTH